MSPQRRSSRRCGTHDNRHRTKQPHRKGRRSRPHSPFVDATSRRRKRLATTTRGVRRSKSPRVSAAASAALATRDVTYRRSERQFERSTHPRSRSTEGKFRAVLLAQAAKEVVKRAIAQKLKQNATRQLWASARKHAAHDVSKAVRHGMNHAAHHVTSALHHGTEHAPPPPRPRPPPVPTAPSAGSQATK